MAKNNFEKGIDSFTKQLESIFGDISSDYDWTEDNIGQNGNHENFNKEDVITIKKENLNATILSIAIFLAGYLFKGIVTKVRKK